MNLNNIGIVIPLAGLVFLGYYVWFTVLTETLKSIHSLIKQSNYKTIKLDDEDMELLRKYGRNGLVAMWWEDMAVKYGHPRNVVAEVNVLARTLILHINK